MISEKENTRISKFLSLVLRHQPEQIGLALDANGWADVSQLIQQCNKAGMALTLPVLEHIVDTNAKKRFAFNDQKDKIRASQGHSVEIELALEPVVPPHILYHGTADRFVVSIQEQGLIKQQRQHVHLSATIETAINVGQRHGKPFVFEVLAEELHQTGHQFFLSANGVWLTDHVPAAYLKPFEQ